MARKATDLLDVFRFGGEDPEASSGGARKPRERKGAKGAGRGRKAARQRFEGLELNRRQVLLASSAVLLLLVLSFTLGLATGRTDGGAPERALQRDSSQSVVIRARLQVVDPVTHQAVRPESLAVELRRDYRIPAENLRVRRDGADLVIEIGPFASREKARHYLRTTGLEMAHIHMEDPFRFADFPPFDWNR